MRLRGWIVFTLNCGWLTSRWIRFFHEIVTLVRGATVFSTFSSPKTDSPYFVSHFSRFSAFTYRVCTMYTHACTQQHKLHVLIIVKQRRSKKERTKRRKNEKKTEEKIHSVRINVYLSSANWTNLAIRKRILYHETVPNIYLLYI